jgi:hypothetical protein
MFVHRKLADGDLYFVDNRNDRAERLDAMFRVDGREAEIWRADTGEINPVSFRFENGRTVVPLELAPSDAVFVVFRKPASASARTLNPPSRATVATVQGPWRVSFQPGRGAPEQITLDQLTSLSTNADAGVKYFSGVATYHASLSAPKAWLKPGARVLIDLGDVKNLAEVRINGTLVGTPWKTPFQVDATGALKPGANEIEVRVANVWANRLIGDRQPGAKAVALTTYNPYPPDYPLPLSGLIGPVTVELESTKPPTR